jgi:hypothetical protein
MRQPFSLKKHTWRNRNEKNLSALRISMDAAHRDRAESLPEMQISTLGGAEETGREAEVEWAAEGIQ